MLPLTPDTIRASFINASQRERANLTLPLDLESRHWDRLDYLGWRDPKLANVGYVIAELDGEPVGVMLRQAEARPRSRAQCSWCEDVRLPNDVVFFSARRAGNAGRNGNTIATLVCAEFQCSANVRKLPPSAYIGFDLEAARSRRIEVLREHAENFVRNVRDGG